MARWARTMIRFRWAVLAVWLVEAVLHTIPHNTAPLRAVIEAPCLFPLTLEQLPATALTAFRHIEIIRHGLDDDLVMLHTPENGFEGKG